MSRSDIGTATGLARTTISKVLGELLDARLVVESDGPPTAGRGRPPTVVAVDPAARFAVGIDFGFRHVRGVLADAAHRVIGSAERRLDVDYTIEHGLETADALVSDLLGAGSIQRSRMRSVGVAVPAPIDSRTGQVTVSAMVPTWSGFRVASALRARLGVPVFAGNDSRLAGEAEFHWGAGRGSANMVYIKLHSGIGGALVLDGAVIRGGRGGAGEFGHMSIDSAGPLCRCGNRGCLEVYAGIPAVLGALRPALGTDVTLGQAMELLSKGHRAVVRVFAEVGARVGQASALLCNATNPDVIVIGGALSAADEVLVPEVRRAMRRGSLAINHDVVVIRGALGRHASAMGAVRLALTEGARAGASAAAALG